ncbi:hypothetical protein BH20ACI2_BH20ACI2_00770 [soil metagenome]
MDDEKLRNQIPILKFLNKHKWRIILPTLLFWGYWSYPFYYAVNIQQSRLYATSTQNASPETVDQEVTNISTELQSDESMLGLIKKYDLFKRDRRQGMPDDQLIEKMRMAMVVGPESSKPSDGIVITKPADGVYVYVLVRLRDEEQEKTAALMDEITNRFQSQPTLSVIKVVNAPLPRSRLMSIGLIIMIVGPGMVFSMILIFIWEIPFLFYSQKTQEMVFDPIRSDWHDERIEAKTHGNIGDTIAVNIRYSFAFVGAMLAKSPIGELFEFVGKVAR